MITVNSEFQYVHAAAVSSRCDESATRWAVWRAVPGDDPFQFLPKIRSQFESSCTHLDSLSVFEQGADLAIARGLRALGGAERRRA